MSDLQTRVTDLLAAHRLRDAGENYLCGCGEKFYYEQEEEHLTHVTTVLAEAGLLIEKTND